MKRTLLTLGTVAAVAAPIAGVVACSSTNKDETYKGSLGDKKLKILTLGDSVAHGDYTFQMSGSGTPFMPFLDGPARAASYQDYLFDEFQRDGLMDENDRPNYRTSASGLRSGELAAWLEKDGTYLSGVAEANQAIIDDPTSSQEEKDNAQKQIDYHRHPYTYGAGKETWWDDGVTKGATVMHTTITDTQQDQVSMADHVAESNVVLITIGGNDILKDIKVMGHQFNRMGEVTDWIDEITKLITKVAADPEVSKLSSIRNVISKIPHADALKTLMGSAKGLQSKLPAILTGQIEVADLIAPIKTTFSEFNKALAAVTDTDKEEFIKWFLKDGHKSLIEVDDKFEASLDGFSKNIKTISDEIHAMNPEANVIFTGYPSPLMHFPKIFRNLAMPFYSQISERTKDFADSAEGVYFAPSSLQNWETDDPTDIYDNILTDPHPTLEGQGAMAKDILKVIDGIYGLNAKLTDKELNAQTADEVESHKLTAPKMSVADRDKALAAGTFPIPYQTAKEVSQRGDIDYTYNVKPLPLEEVAHAKVYFGARIGMFLIDAITDSIKLNPTITTNDEPTVPHHGPLTLSSFTKEWGDKFAATTGDIPFIIPDKNFGAEVLKEFESSLKVFSETFIKKLNGVLDLKNAVTTIPQLMSMIK